MIRRPFPFLVATFAWLVFAVSTARAWNNTGHKTVAWIACQEMDAGAKTKLFEILKSHPHFESFLTKNTPDGVDKIDWAFMNAAVWPDWIRGGPRAIRKYNQPTWHYFDKPYIVEGDKELADKLKADFEKKDRGEILLRIPESLKILKKPADTDDEKAERAMRLCWIFHLIGDLHQPLHATALCTKELPDGDKGGNYCWVTRPGGGEPINLHALWDRMAGNFEEEKALVGLGRLIQTKTTVTDAQRKEASADVWADESLELSKTCVYVFHGTPIDKILATSAPTKAPELPGAYEKESRQIAYDRIAQAAARLALALKTAVE
jgi:S1/P1 Nuclease